MKQSKVTDNWIHESSMSHLAKTDKAKLKHLRIKSPNTQKMFSIRRGFTTYYFSTLKKLNQFKERYMYNISKEFAFSASHQLLGLPIGHPCSNIHGHNYVVTMELSACRLNEIGFVLDYKNLDMVKDYIDHHLDHKHLNDVLKFNPTAENIAKHLFLTFRRSFPQLLAVTVQETPKTTARYTSQGDENPDTI